jgi:hypothetical protein
MQGSQKEYLGPSASDVFVMIINSSFSKKQFFSHAILHLKKSSYYILLKRKPPKMCFFISWCKIGSNIANLK